MYKALNLYPLVEHGVGEDVVLEGISLLRLKGRQDVALGGLSNLVTQTC